jgi:hypothetical protein
VQADRGQPDDRVARRDPVGVGHRVELDQADDRAGQVEVVGPVHARHLGGLAAQQRAAVRAAGAVHAGHHQRGDLGVQLAHRQVVQEEQRVRAGHQDVVDAVVHQVRADGVVAAHGGGDEDLRADAVGRTHQRALGVAREPEQAAEAAQAAQLVGVRPSRRHVAIALDGQVAGVDVDAGAGVGVAHRRAAPRTRVNANRLSFTVGSTASVPSEELHARPCLARRGCVGRDRRARRPGLRR